MASLIVTKASGSEQCFQLKSDNLIVGRDEICDVVLADNSVSRRHAQIARRDQGYLIEDLGSKNGTLLDGRPVDRAELTDGAAIDFGDVRAFFILDDRKHDPKVRVVEHETIVGRRGDYRFGSIDLGFLVELAEAAATCGELGEMAEAVMAVFLQQLHCENVYLGLSSSRTDEIRHHYHRRSAKGTSAFAYSQAIVDKAIAERTSVLVRDAAGSRAWRKQQSVLQGGIQSMLCVPLIAAGRLAGVIYADTRSRHREFTENDLALANALGPLIAAIFHRLEDRGDVKRSDRTAKSVAPGALLIGSHSSMARIRKALAMFASKGDAPILIEGESGTGKELAARMAHQLSGRAKQPFLDINCAAVPRDLMESELFGHVKGAFTSASAKRRGLFELAAGGTLLLDEIGELPLDLQGKLLRVLETKTFRPIGGEANLQADARIIASTNRDLRRMVGEGLFRPDLFFRLNVLYVRMPPLREHPEDISELARHFLKQLSEKISTRVTAIDPAAMDRLAAYSWPGNGRELKNVIERAIYACEGCVIQEANLLGLDCERDPAVSTEAPIADRMAELAGQLFDAEKERLRETLDRHRWNRTRAAEELGISRKTLIAKIRKFELR